MINSASFFNLLVTKITAVKHAIGKTIVVVEGRLKMAISKSIDDECPPDISWSNNRIALLIQKIDVNKTKKKTKIKNICFNMY